MRNSEIATKLEIIPPNSEARRRIVVRFGANTEIPFQNWIVEIHLIENHLIPPPRELPALCKTDIDKLLGWEALLPSISPLWQGSSIALQPNRSSSIFNVNLSVSAGN